MFINKIAESKPQNNNLGLAGVETSLTNLKQLYSLMTTAIDINSKQ